LQRRIGFFVLFALLAAALFVRLGFWQLHRLGERKAVNATMGARFAAPVVDLRSLGSDTAAARFRRARAQGTPDYAHEIVIAARSHEGSPGVNILTPVRVAGSDTALLVNRGWVYAPDGVTVDLNRWRESDTVFTGYADPIGPLPIVMPSAAPGPRSVRRLSERELAELLPYPVAPVLLVALVAEPAASNGGGGGGMSGAGGGAPSQTVVRLSAPTLDEGPHLGYAIQWFAFAIIAVVGAVVIAIRTRNAPAPDRTERLG
jgi:surfeit locus 1 family protein